MAVHRVLLVDDDDDIRCIAAMSLTRLGGMEVHQASSGAAGLEMARALLPDVILLDMMMPGMDGERALEHLRADPVTAAIPVVFMTAKVMHQEIARWLSLGAVGVIHKPFDPLTLHIQVREAAARGEGQHGA